MARPAYEILDVARGAVEAATAALIEREAGTRRGEDPEELHKMRVASRRLRAALSTFAPLFPAPRKLRKLRRRLRRLTRALAAVRECDVHAAMLRAALEKEGESTTRCALEHAAGAVAARRERERLRLIEFLDDLDLPRLVRRVRGLAEDAEVADPALSPEDFGAYVLDERLGRAFGGIDRSAARENAGALHARRIEMKRLRYAVEALGPALPKELSEAIVAFAKRLQEALGRHHDAVTLGAAIEAERKACVESGRAALAAGLARVAARIRAERAAAFRDYRKIAELARDLVPERYLGKLSRAAEPAPGCDREAEDPEPEKGHGEREPAGIDGPRRRRGRGRRGLGRGRR
jgi:CHAD domain-containing protein